jgi:hypothetical protein
MWVMSTASAGAAWNKFTLRFFDRSSPMFSPGLPHRRRFRNLQNVKIFPPKSPGKTGCFLQKNRESATVAYSPAVSCG